MMWRAIRSLPIGFEKTPRRLSGLVIEADKLKIVERDHLAQLSRKRICHAAAVVARGNRFRDAEQRFITLLTWRSLNSLRVNHEAHSAPLQIALPHTNTDFRESGAVRTLQARAVYI
jgi:hypothetical protein